VNNQSKYAAAYPLASRQTGPELGGIEPRPGSGFNPIVKTCPCCGRKYTAAQWHALGRGFTIDLPADERGPEEHYEYKNCFCGSTIGTDIELLFCVATGVMP
jgi:hypothetical protein